MDMARRLRRRWLGRGNWCSRIWDLGFGVWGDTLVLRRRRPGRSDLSPWVSGRQWFGPDLPGALEWLDGLTYISGSTNRLSGHAGGSASAHRVSGSILISPPAPVGARAREELRESSTNRIATLCRPA